MATDDPVPSATEPPPVPELPPLEDLDTPVEPTSATSNSTLHDMWEDDTVRGSDEEDDMILTGLAAQPTQYTAPEVLTNSSATTFTDTYPPPPIGSMTEEDDRNGSRTPPPPTRNPSSSSSSAGGGIFGRTCFPNQPPPPPSPTFSMSPPANAIVITSNGHIQPAPPGVEEPCPVKRAPSTKKITDGKTKRLQRGTSERLKPYMSEHVRNTMKWEWTLDVSKYEMGSSARKFYDRQMGEYLNTIHILLVTDNVQKIHCSEMLLQIIDRLFLLFDGLCDPHDDALQDAFTDLTRQLSVELFDRARPPAHQLTVDYDKANARETQFLTQAFTQEPELQARYKQYMHFLRVVVDKEEVHYLRDAFLTKDSVHRAYLLPMLSLCNIAAQTGRPFAASILSLICVKVCRIVELAHQDQSSLPVGWANNVLMTCWDLFDSIVRGQLANAESKILREVCIRDRAFPALPTASSSSTSKTTSPPPSPPPPPPLPPKQESGGCSVQ